MNLETPFVVGVEVLKVETRERSNVHGGGGGGFSYKGTGFTLPVDIRTSHERHTEVWVKLEDGTEDRLDFAGIDFLVREGHTLALLLGGTEIWAIKNFATNTTTRFVAAEHFLPPKKEFSLRWLGPLFIGACIVIGAPVGAVVDMVGWSDKAKNWAAAGAALLGALAAYAWLSSKAEAKWTKRVQDVEQRIESGLAMLETVHPTRACENSDRLRDPE